MREPSRRIQFLDDLAALIDGDPDVEQRHQDLLGENPAVAELREQAQRLAARLGEAGVDYAPSPQFHNKLEQAIVARQHVRARPARSRERTATKPLYQLNPKSTPPSVAKDPEVKVVGSTKERK